MHLLQSFVKFALPFYQKMEATDLLCCAFAMLWIEGTKLEITLVYVHIHAIRIQDTYSIYIYILHIEQLSLVPGVSLECMVLFHILFVILFLMCSLRRGSYIWGSGLRPVDKTVGLLPMNPTLVLHIPYQGTLEDDFPFTQVGYVIVPWRVHPQWIFYFLP